MGQQLAMPEKCRSVKMAGASVVPILPSDLGAGTVKQNRSVCRAGTAGVSCGLATGGSCCCCWKRQGSISEVRDLFRLVVVHLRTVTGFRSSFRGMRSICTVAHVKDPTVLMSGKYTYFYLVDMGEF
jgi:hypothetical protein